MKIVRPTAFLLLLLGSTAVAVAQLGPASPNVPAPGASPSAPAYTAPAPGAADTKVDQGAAGASPWPTAVYVGGAAASTSNPSPVAVGNFPTSQTVTNAGTFAVQNMAPVVGGNSAAVKVDGSAVTQPVSATALPLPAGASTAAAQAAIQNAPGTSGTKADAVQGVTGGVPVPVSSAGATSWQFSTTGATPVAANGTQNFNTRQGGAGGAGFPYAYYSVQLFTPSGAGTLYVFDTSISGTPVIRGIAQVTANTPATLRVPAIGQLLAQFQSASNSAVNVYFADMFSNN